MEQHMDYFGDALALVDQFGLRHIISFNNPFDADLVAQFFATVFFHNDEDRNITWMCDDDVLTCKWKVFMDLLQVPYTTADEPVGLRPHTSAPAKKKGELAPYQTSVVYYDAKGNEKHKLMLTPFLDIMHQIFRTSLFPRVGDLDKIHSYLVNMILLCQEYRGTAMTLDICSIMYEELYTAVMERKVPIYGPYLQLLFEKVWSDTYEDPLRVGHLTRHEVVQLRIKANWAGGEAAAQGSPVASDAEMADEEGGAGDADEPAAGGGSVRRTRSGTSFGGSGRSSSQDLEQPGWAAKLTRKVKKLFCMQSHMQHKMYLAHKREKENRQRQKLFYRHQGMEVQSGSEGQITEEDKWIYQFSTWEIDVDTAGTSASAPHADETVEEPAEESEAGSSDESDDGDDDYQADE
jgi:hypothetical protein